MGSTHSKNRAMKYNEWIIGIDEVGYGAWAGPVYTCAVCFPTRIPNELLLEIKDSKKLSKKTRENLCHSLKEIVKYGIGYASNQEIDESNVLQATHLAMSRAVANLNVNTSNYQILVDGKIRPTFLDNITPVIHGDSEIKQISAASIIAKVTRDELMHELHEKYPVYGWNTNVGYGTQVHREAIKKYGISKYHRISYKPLSKNYAKIDAN